MGELYVLRSHCIHKNRTFPNQVSVAFHLTPFLFLGEEKKIPSFSSDSSEKLGLRIFGNLRWWVLRSCEVSIKSPVDELLILLLLTSLLEVFTNQS